MDWHLFIRDSSGNKVALGDRYLGFKSVFNWNDGGKFSLGLRDGTYEADLISWGTGVSLQYKGSDFFGGDFTRIAETGSGSGGQAIRLEGLDDTGLLARRLCYPDPAVEFPPYNTQAYDVRTGAGETLIKQYAYYNIGAGAVASRRLANFTNETDLGRGKSITYRARFHNLLEVIQEIALAAGLGFRVVNRQLQVYEPQDCSNSVVFSYGLGNLLSYEYYENSPEFNYLIAGGSGEGTSRNFSLYQDPASIVTHGRYEGFYDRRNLSVTAELAQAAAIKMLEAGAVYAASFNPVESPNASFYPVEDYWLGDKIRLITNRGTVLNGVVRQFSFSLNPSGAVQFTPVIGSENARQVTAFAATNKRLATLESGLQNLERI